MTDSLISVLGAGGHGGVTLIFRNDSARTCTLLGYPGTAVPNGSGPQVGQATRTLYGYLGGLPPHTTNPPLVVIASGGTAAAGLEWVENEQGVRPAAQPTPPSS